MLRLVYRCTGFCIKALPGIEFHHCSQAIPSWQNLKERVTQCSSTCCCRKSEAKNRAVVLEMIGDLPEADSKPPSNMLFIAKLNQVTTEEDLETIFGRFGNITSCDIIRDKKTGDSLCYAFLGYDTDEACENAYFKMNNVLIDDRRIKVTHADHAQMHLQADFCKISVEHCAKMRSDLMQCSSTQPMNAQLQLHDIY